jgi:hypothetical protein
MTALEQLNEYLRSLEQKLRIFAASRGAAIVATLSLALTIILVSVGNHYRFATGIVLPFRVLLYLCVALAITLAVVLPLLKLKRSWIVRLVEKRSPDFEERLLTIAERPDPENPFTEILAEDALRVARLHDPRELSPFPILLACIGTAVVAAGVLIWMITAAPGYWSYGAALLWTGHAGTAPLYEISVQPGNKTVRKKSDQSVTAQLLGFSSQTVTIHAKPNGSLKWEQAEMRPQRDGNGYQFLFTSLAEPVEYYVQAGASQSKHFTLGVRDLPGVKRIRVGVHFPSNLGLTDVVNDPGGDIRAVEGSEAEISVLTDRPLKHGMLVLDDGSKVGLAEGDGNWLTAKLPIRKDGSYHVAVLDEGEMIRLTDDYFIEAKKDEPPVVKIVRPGRDPHVSPIEEVPVTVEASDDFEVKGLELHYSVNGGTEQTVPLLKAKRVKQADGKTTLYFENFKVVPGDLVSFYATAKDATRTAKTDIVLAKTEPFDFAFRQSQQSGGGGGGAGEENTNISQRQSEIIAATWNEEKDGNKDKSKTAEDARFLSDLQGKLGEQAKTLANRMRSREMASEGSAFADFSKQMDQASDEMGKAVGSLKTGNWKEAMPPEQKALQSLLRAEAMFREIQVAFGRQSGGGGGGGANRDLERMFDLELDTDKNQYETGESPSSPDQQQKSVDDAVERLQALARRQQELATQQRQAEAFQQRWEQEMLRREAEQLRQQMQQLAQNQLNRPQQGNSSQSGQSQGGQQSSGSSSQSGQASKQNASRQAAMNQAMQALQRAEDQMRKAVSEHNSSAQQEAASQLQKAQDLMNGMQRQQAGDSLSDLARQAEAMAQQQKDFENRLRQMYGGSGMNSESTPPGINPWMNDPRFENRMDYFPKHTSPQTDRLANEGEKRAQQLEQLQRQIQRQVQSMAAGQPDDASRLRKALSDAEQAELTSQMKKNANWIRNGLGRIAVAREPAVTAGLDDLSRQLQDAQAGMKNGSQNAQNGTPGPKDGTAQALAQVQKLRRQLESQMRPGQGQQGQGQQGQGQKGQGQQGQGQQGQGQDNSGQDGEGQAQEGQAGQGQPQQGGGRGGAWSPRGGGRPSIQAYNGAGGYSGTDENVQETIRALKDIRDRLGPNDRQLNYDVDYALGYLRGIYSTKAGELEARIDREVLPSLARLELELSRQAGAQPTGARTAATETAPEKYKDAVAEYFRKLSR